VDRSSIRELGEGKRKYIQPVFPCSPDIERMVRGMLRKGSVEHGFTYTFSPAHKKKGGKKVKGQRGPLTLKPRYKGEIRNQQERRGGRFLTAALHLEREEGKGKKGETVTLWSLLT